MNLKRNDELEPLVDWVLTRQQDQGSIMKKNEPDSPQFSKDFTSPHAATWMRVLSHLKGQPDLRYLEIGVLEGRTLLWMFENILTHPSSTATAVEIEPGPTLFRNLRLAGLEQRVTLRNGDSRKTLRQFPDETFDFIYVDGSHLARSVLIDAVLAWELLKPGGVLIFDDYLLYHREELPIELKPKVALDALLTCYSNALELLHQDYQLIVRKLHEPPFCARTDQYSKLGDYFYSWNFFNGRLGNISAPRGLFRVVAGERKAVVLSSKKERLIRRRLLAKQFGEVSPRLDNRRTRKFRRLLAPLRRCVDGLMYLMRGGPLSLP